MKLPLLAMCKQLVWVLVLWVWEVGCIAAGCSGGLQLIKFWVCGPMGCCSQRGGGWQLAAGKLQGTPMVHAGAAAAAHHHQLPMPPVSDMHRVGD